MTELNKLDAIKNIGDSLLEISKEASSSAIDDAKTATRHALAGSASWYLMYESFRQIMPWVHSKLDQLDLLPVLDATGDLIVEQLPQVFASGASYMSTTVFILIAICTIDE